MAWSAGDMLVTSSHVVTRKKAIVVTPDGRAVEARSSPAMRHATSRWCTLPQRRFSQSPRATLMRCVPARLWSQSVTLWASSKRSASGAQAVGALPQGYGLNGKGSLAWVQADVRLAPGNSGGPIADVDGNVIGVAAMIVSGLALAVPVTDVERLLASLG